MRIVSPAALDALSGTREQTFQADVIDVITRDVLLSDLPITSGRLSGTLLSQHRWGAVLEIPSLDYIPDSPEHPLSGLSLTYLRLSERIGTAAGPEPVILCDLLVQDCEITREAGSDVLTVTAVSPSLWIQEAGLPFGFQPLPGGETVAAAIERIADESLPYSIPVLYDGPVADVPAEFTAAPGGDPWRTIEDLAASVDLVAYTDALSRLIIAEPASLSGDAIPLSVSGTITGTSAAVGRSLFYNRARVTFSDPELGDVIGDAAITAGPLSWDGPAGRRLYQESRPGRVSQSDADAYAGSLLTSAGLGIRPSYVTAAPDPRLMPGDPVLLRYSSGRQERSIATSVDYALRIGEPMTLGTRSNG
jgi:hypothetical protein